MRTGLLLLLCALATGAQNPPNACDMPADVADAISRVEGMRANAYDIVAMRDIMRSAVQRHPDDVFANLEYLFLYRERGHDGVIGAYRSMMERHPGDRRYELFYAASLIGTNTPEALRRLEAIAAPDFPYPYWLMGQIQTYDRFRNMSAAAVNIIRFAEACPAYLPGYEDLSFLGSGEELKSVAAQLRDILKERTDNEAIHAYGWLWNMEFRAAPPADHDRLRAQINSDVRRLGLANSLENPVAVRTLSQAYRITGDESALRALPRREPPMEPAIEAQQKWGKAHPFPKDGSAEDLATYYRAVAGAAREAIAKWPQHPFAYGALVAALSHLPDTPERELVDAGEQLVAIGQSSSGRFAAPPSVQVASAYLARNIRLDEIPKLVDAGLVEADVPSVPESDLFDDRNHRLNEEQRYQGRIQARAVLFDWAMKASRLDTARGALASMRQDIDGFLATAIQLYPAKFQEAEYWAKKAKLADVEGKPSDAASYRQLAEEARRTPGRANTVSESGKVEGKRLPPFQAVGLDGRKWTAADLEGKTAIMNLWATWCAPCVEELPYVQRLSEKLKDKTAVVVLALNADANPGLVHPFLKTRGMTMPILLAYDFVEAAMPEMAIPRTWFVQSGIVRFEEIGFNDRDTWVDRMAAKVEEILTAR